MKITLEETEFSQSWEGDGMRRGDNIREHTWTGQLVTIELAPEDDPFTAQAVKEFDRQQPLSCTVDSVRDTIKSTADRLRWVDGWEKFYNQPQAASGWYVGTDYAPKDRPEVYDKYGNYLMIVPRKCEPGNFAALAAELEDQFYE